MVDESAISSTWMRQLDLDRCQWMDWKHRGDLDVIWALFWSQVVIWGLLACVEKADGCACEPCLAALLEGEDDDD